MTTADDVQALRHLPLWTDAEEVQRQIRSAAGRTTTDRHTLSRVDAAVVYLLGYKGLSPYLFPSLHASGSAFQELDACLVQISSQLEGWETSSAMTRTTVSQLDQQADRILYTLANAPWPSLQRESRAKVVLEAGRSFQDRTERAVEKLLDDINAGQDQLSELFSRMERLEGEAEARGTQAEAALREIDDAREENVAASKAAVNEAVKTEMTKGESVRKNFEAQANVHVASLAANAKRGEKLVKLVGDQAVGEGYAKFAGREMWAYRLWNIAGIAAGLAVLLYLGYEFRQLDSVTPQAAIVRVAISIPGLGIAAYAFQQASRRHKQSVEARYRALDLLALEPFTNDMDPEQQTGLRVALGQRLFASNPQDATTTTDDQAPELSVSQLQNIVDLIKSAQGLVK